MKNNPHTERVSSLMSTFSMSHWIIKPLGRIKRRKKEKKRKNKGKVGKEEKGGRGERS